MAPALPPGPRSIQAPPRPGAARPALAQNLLALCYSQRHDLPVPYLMSAIVRGLWTPQAISLCQQAGVEIHPRFRSAHSDVAWRRRFRRALDRIKLPLALARQGRRVIDLDSP